MRRSSSINIGADGVVPKETLTGSGFGTTAVVQRSPLQGGTNRSPIRTKVMFLCKAGARRRVTKCQSGNDQSSRTVRLVNFKTYQIFVGFSSADHFERIAADQHFGHARS